MINSNRIFLCRQVDNDLQCFEPPNLKTPAAVSLWTSYNTWRSAHRCKYLLEPISNELTTLILIAETGVCSLNHCTIESLSHCTIEPLSHCEIEPLSPYTIIESFAFPYSPFFAF